MRTSHIKEMRGFALMAMPIDSFPRAQSLTAPTNALISAVQKDTGSLAQSDCLSTAPGNRGSVAIRNYHAPLLFGSTTPMSVQTGTRNEALLRMLEAEDAKGFPAARCYSNPPGHLTREAKEALAKVPGKPIAILSRNGRDCLLSIEMEMPNGERKELKIYDSFLPYHDFLKTQTLFRAVDVPIEARVEIASVCDKVPNNFRPGGYLLQPKGEFLMPYGSFDTSHLNREDLRELSIFEAFLHSQEAQFYAHGRQTSGLVFDAGSGIQVAKYKHPKTGRPMLYLYNPMSTSQDGNLWQHVKPHPEDEPLLEDYRKRFTDVARQLDAICHLRYDAKPGDEAINRVEYTRQVDAFINSLKQNAIFEFYDNNQVIDQLYKSPLYQAQASPACSAVPEPSPAPPPAVTTTTAPAEAHQAGKTAPAPPPIKVEKTAADYTRLSDALIRENSLDQLRKFITWDSIETMKAHGINIFDKSEMRQLHHAVMKKFIGQYNLPLDPENIPVERRLFLHSDENNYGHDEDWGRAMKVCLAVAAKKMERGEITSLMQLQDTIADHHQFYKRVNFNAPGFPCYRRPCEGFAAGLKRNCDIYMRYSAQALKMLGFPAHEIPDLVARKGNYWDVIGTKHEFTLKDHGQVIPLGSINGVEFRMAGYGLSFQAPDPITIRDQINPYVNRLFTDIIRNEKGRGTPDTLRRIGIIHNILAKSIQYENGNATVSDSVTKVLLDYTGIQVDRWRDDISPDRLAFVTPHEEYGSLYHTLFNSRPIYPQLR